MLFTIHHLLFTALLLCSSFAHVASSGTNDGAEKPPGVEVVSFNWKYEGYGPVEVVDSGKTTTTLSMKRKTAYVFKYRAQAVVRNAGAKAIKSVQWDYVFFDAEKGKELKRYKLQSKQEIPAGRSQTLLKDVIIEPEDDTRHITTARQKVLITRLEFADGTSWRPADN